jgi:hypothetical protein
LLFSPSWSPIPGLKGSLLPQWELQVYVSVAGFLSVLSHIFLYIRVKELHLCFSQKCTLVNWYFIVPALLGYIFIAAHSH